MSLNLSFELSNKLYKKDPQQTELGRSIIQYSILLIDELGLESFTFKKLASKIKSTEASVYRYFDNKHLLLLYLISWYWEWVQYLIQFNTNNVSDPQSRLDIIIETIIKASEDNSTISYVNESNLYHIVLAESSKAYHTKAVDRENKEGIYDSLIELNQCISKAIKQVNPDFPFSRNLANTILDMASNQLFISEHIPKISDLSKTKKNRTELTTMIKLFTNRVICNKN